MTGGTTPLLRHGSRNQDTNNANIAPLAPGKLEGTKRADTLQTALCKDWVLKNIITELSTVKHVFGATVTKPPVKLHEAIFLLTCQKKDSSAFWFLRYLIFDSRSLTINVISVSSMLQVELTQILL